MSKYWHILPPPEQEKFLVTCGNYHLDAWTQVVADINKHWEVLAVNRKLEFELLRMKGYSLYHLCEFAQALTCFNSALSINPDCKKCRENLDRTKAETLQAMQQAFHQKQWRLLHELATAYLEVDKGCDDAQFFLAVSCDEYANHTDRSEKLFAQLVEKNPKSSLYWRGYALSIHRNNNKIDEAISVCEHGVAYLRQHGRAYGDVEEILTWLKDLRQERTNKHQKVERKSTH